MCFESFNFPFENHKKNHNNFCDVNSSMSGTALQWFLLQSARIYISQVKILCELKFEIPPFACLHHINKLELNIS